MTKKTLVIGASEHADRYSYQAVQLLKHYGHEVVAIGAQEGKIGDTEIQVEYPQGEEFDTVTMYINPLRQKSLEDTIIQLQPQRIIFNPGSENNSLAQKARAKGIEVEEACTLVMLRTGQY